jgi:hypothetical protein
MKGLDDQLVPVNTIGAPFLEQNMIDEDRKNTEVYVALGRLTALPLPTKFLFDMTNCRI